MDINSFEGTYTVRTANQNYHGNQYIGFHVQPGDGVSIAPRPDHPNQVSITFTPTSGGAGQEYTYDYSGSSESLYCEFQNIPFTDPAGNPQVTDGRMEISLLIGNNGYKAIYAAFIAGDPQQVGVWGADNGGG